MFQGVYVLGGKCPGGKCPGGKCPGGICPWGKCPGGTCPGGLCPRTRIKVVIPNCCTSCGTCGIFTTEGTFYYIVGVILLHE